MITKMKYISLLFVIVFSGTGSDLYAQYSENSFSISVNANYTTTAKVYNNPNSADINQRNRSVPIEDIYSPSLDIRYRLSQSIILGLNLEKIEKTGTGEIVVQTNSGNRVIPITEGFSVIPVEFFIHYLVPFSTETFKFLIGGGTAYYYGSHIRRVGDQEVSNIKREFAYGIQVNISTDYLITDFLSVRGEMKFRDPEFELTSRYNQQSAVYNGQRIFFTREEFDSRINIDGVTFTLGIAFHF